MTARQVASATPIALSVLSCAVVLFLVWQRRKGSAAARHYAWVMVGEVWWGAGYFAELTSSTLQWKVFWDAFQVLPAYIVCLEALRFVYEYIGQQTLRSRARLAALWAIPVVHLAFVYTTPLHHVLYGDAQLVPTEPFGTLAYTLTPLDWFCYVYALGIMLLTMGVLAAHGLRQRGPYRAQLVPVLVGMSLPLVATVLFFSGVTFLGQRDAMPYAFALSAVVVSRPLLRQRLFDLLPIAHHAVIAAAPEAVLVIDDGGRIVEVNAAMKAFIVTDEELVGRPLAEAIPWAAAAVGAGPWEPVDIELSRELLIEARGTDVKDSAGRKLGRVLTFHDVTLTRRAANNLKYQKEELERRVHERTAELELAQVHLKREAEEHKNTERQLAQAQKMESLGRLAGGVAHDFNNLLTAILGNIELARMDLPEGSPVRQNLDEVQHASESAKALVRQLLVFGRKHGSEVMVVDLRLALSDATRLLARLLGEDVRLVLELPDVPVHVKLDPMQLEQVVVNLAVNARDAMPRGGKLSIRVERLPEDLVRINVSDTGVGMTEEVRARAFEPFFTTKPVGKGTGLGLSLVFAVVRQNGGSVSIESELGRGTTFSIDFPEVEARESSPTKQPSGLAGVTGGTEKIVLVEDQRELSRFAQRSLRKLGYTVVAFASAEEALAARDQLDGAHLLLSDVVLPGLSGPDLAEALSATHPRLRVLFASGYHEESLKERSGKVAAMRVLAKPFSIEQLASAIRETLDSGAASNRSQRLGAEAR
ncbi:MAG TPA: histidine kinase N-terminal 7TM domain-containing protein [Polyangiaceae bacterium]|nr:histidine kinase N-terminal 7TM domain-containing protein [Polyangiaceae bacterium]